MSISTSTTSFRLLQLDRTASRYALGVCIYTPADSKQYIGVYFEDNKDYLPCQITAKEPGGRLELAVEALSITVGGWRGPIAVPFKTPTVPEGYYECVCLDSEKEAVRFLDWLLSKPGKRMKLDPQTPQSRWDEVLAKTLIPPGSEGAKQMGVDAGKASSPYVFVGRDYTAEDWWKFAAVQSPPQQNTALQNEYERVLKIRDAWAPGSTPWNRENVQLRKIKDQIDNQKTPKPVIPARIEDPLPTMTYAEQAEWTYVLTSRNASAAEGNKTKVENLDRTLDVMRATAQAREKQLATNRLKNAVKPLHRRKMRGSDD